MQHLGTLGQSDNCRSEKKSLNYKIKEIENETTPTGKRIPNYYSLNFRKLKKFKKSENFKKLKKKFEFEIDGDNRLVEEFMSSVSTVGKYTNQGRKKKSGGKMEMFSKKSPKNAKTEKKMKSKFRKQNQSYKKIPAATGFNFRGKNWDSSVTSRDTPSESLESEHAQQVKEKNIKRRRAVRTPDYFSS